MSIRKVLSRAVDVFRTLTACAAAIVVTSALAAQGSGVAPTAAPEKLTYIVVLSDRAPADESPDPGEPDIPGLGGEVLHRWHNRRVIRMPAAAVRALVAHRGVKYIQRVQTDGAVPPLPDSLPTSGTIATTGAVASDWAPPTWSSGDYVYDGDGNITQIGTTAKPASDGGKETYLYDSAGRLIKAATSHSPAHSESYTYDSFGNLVNTARTAGPSTATPADKASNRLQGVTYDGAGNVIAHPGDTAEYFYDGVNMVRAKSTSNGLAWYIYTADDERIGVEENGERRWMIRDLSGRVLREWEGDPNWWLWREDYVYRDGALAAAEREPAEGGTRHFHLDHLGTPRLITDANKAKLAAHDYFPFGVEKTDFRQEMTERGTDRPEPMKFTGHERDFTAGTQLDNRNQLDYMHARYYNPVWGRFLSVDPYLDIKRALREPQSWNRYAYVTNNPLRYTDPDGRDRYQEPGFTKPLSEANDWDEHPSVSWAFYAQGGLLSLAAGGPLRNAAFQGSLLLMRNPGTVLAAMKVLDSMGGNVSGHINPAGQTGGKLGFLLGNVASEKSMGRGGFFAGVMGFTAKTLDGTIRSHFADNFKNGVLQKDGRLAVTGAMTGANGVVATVKTVWQWNKEKKVWDLITSVPAR